MIGRSKLRPLAKGILSRNRLCVRVFALGAIFGETLQFRDVCGLLNPNASTDDEDGSATAISLVASMTMAAAE